LRQEWRESIHNRRSIPAVMLHEVINALFITYVATEWQLASNEDRLDQTVPPWRRVIESRVTQVCTIIVVLVNISTRLHIHLTGSKALSFADAAVTKISHLPRVVFAAVAYIVALYFDCRRSQGDLAFGNFLKRVGVAFLRVAPVYPFLAVAISFAFLFIISAFEALHLPLEILNLPIYYGTLYGPFSWIYYTVKRRVVESSGSLPTMIGSHCARNE